MCGLAISISAGKEKKHPHSTADKPTIPVFTLILRIYVKLSNCLISFFLLVQQIQQATLGVILVQK